MDAVGVAHLGDPVQAAVNVMKLFSFITDDEA
jgi:hypothetical protein